MLRDSLVEHFLGNSVRVKISRMGVMEGEPSQPRRFLSVAADLVDAVPTELEA